MSVFYFFSNISNYYLNLSVFIINLKISVIYDSIFHFSLFIKVSMTSSEMSKEVII